MRRKEPEDNRRVGGGAVVCIAALRQKGAFTQVKPNSKHVL